MSKPTQETTGSDELDVFLAARDGWIRRDADGDRLYALLGLYDTRDGSMQANLIRAAREGWERSHLDMAEQGVWDEFDALWAKYGDRA
jgi:hypothetical protein